MCFWHCWIEEGDMEWLGSVKKRFGGYCLKMFGFGHWLEFAD